MIGNKCRVKDCNKIVTVKGTLCSMHRTRWQDHKTFEPSAKAKNRFQPVVGKAGYIRVNNGKKRVLQHRHIVEQSICRPLKNSEIIHHINGDRTDNRIENLLITTISEHARKYDARKKGYWNEVKEAVAEHIKKPKQSHCFCGDKAKFKNLCRKHYSVAYRHKFTP